MLNNATWLVSDDYFPEKSLRISQKIIPFTQQSDTAAKIDNYYREYIIDDAALYNGSILEPLPPSKNKSIERYLNHDLRINHLVTKL